MVPVESEMRDPEIRERVENSHFGFFLYTASSAIHEHRRVQNQTDSHVPLQYCVHHGDNNSNQRHKR